LGALNGDSGRSRGGTPIPIKGWFLRLAVESHHTHRKVLEVNPFLPYAKSKHAIPVKSDVYGAGILKAEEPHNS
jgi:hypothetical protein